MEAEFVNEYISRLLANLNDVTNKAILLEARVHIYEKKMAELQVELEKTKQRIKKQPE
jgi:peptidoglycan hydrolase CwlO-like protein